MHLILTHKENLRHLVEKDSGVSISIRLLTQKMELHVQIGDVKNKLTALSQARERMFRLFRFFHHGEALPPSICVGF